MTTTTQDGDTGATPTAGITINEAADRIAALRKQPSPPEDGTGDEGEQRTQPAAASSGAPEIDELDEESNPEEGNPDEGEIEETSEEEPSQDDPDKTPKPDNGKVFSLDTWTEEELNRKVVLNIRGEPYETTVAEALKGHMREAVFTQKMQEASKVAELHVQRRDQYEQALPLLASIVEQQLANGRTEEQWKELFDSDPIEYVREREIYQQKREQFDALVQESKRIQHEKQMEAAQQTAKFLGGEVEKLCNYLGIKVDDPAARSKYVQGVYSYLKNSPDLRLSDSDCAAIMDHRAFKIIDKAMKYDALQKAKQTVKTKEVPPVNNRPLVQTGGKPAAARATSAQIAEKKALGQLKQSGKIDDAAAAIGARRLAAQKRR